MPQGNIYFHEFINLLAIGAGIALAGVGSIAGANHLSAQPLPPHLEDGLRDFLNNNFGQFGVNV